ncbi:MAG: DNA replication and repair protein RecF [Bdellovibrionaceae bacterium]|nr:DNA replication and repair protein RecF [Pseudobdellovibrionaceae bacterium]
MLKRLRLFDFRNFKEQWVDFSAQTNVFVGDNGQGKSNILEAIYLLLTGESFRPSEVSHYVKWGSEAASLRGLFENDQHEALDVFLKIQNGKKALTVNEKKFTAQDWRRMDPPILFSPESLNAIKGSAEERRALVDELVLNLSPIAHQTHQDFRKALRMRNKILRDHRDARESGIGLGAALEKPVDKTLALLEALNPKFLELAVIVTQQRIEALRKLEPDVNLAMQSVSEGFPAIQLQYWISQQPAIHYSHQDIHNSLQKRLKELQSAELSSGTSLVGPHKHDIVFLFGGNDSRFFCSQGQQRSLILAFKVAQIVYHRKVLKRRPILLLDDVLSELDGAKRKNFVELMKTMESQIVLTTTDYDLPQVFSSTSAESQISLKRVLDGRVTD